MDEEKEPRLQSWERRLLIVAFGGWAVVVASYGQAAIDRIDRLAEAMQSGETRNAEVHNMLERRVTIVEQNDKVMQRDLDKINDRIDDELDRVRP